MSLIHETLQYILTLHYFREIVSVVVTVCDGNMIPDAIHSLPENAKTTYGMEVRWFSCRVDHGRRELEELRCREREMQHQVEVIKSALSELGCEEVPPGCDLSIDSSFVDNHTNMGTPNTEQQQVL